MTFMNRQDPFSACNMISFVITTLILTVLFRWIMLRRKLYLLSWKLPGPMAIPFLGNICPKIQDIPRVMKRFEEESKKYSSPYRLWYGSRLIVVFTEPQQINSVLTECYIPCKPGMYYYWALGLGSGLLTAHGGLTWRRNRLLMNAAFDNTALTYYQEVVNKQARKMAMKMHKLVGEGTNDIGLNSQRMCFDVITEALLKEDEPKFQEDNLDSFIKLFHRISTTIQNRATTCWLRCEFLFYYTKDAGVINMSRIVLQNFFKDIFKRRKEEFLTARQWPAKDGREIVKTPLDIMLEAQFTGNRPFDTEIIDEILNLYQAGADPTAACISFFLLMLATHQDVQDRLYDEIIIYFEGMKPDEVRMEDLGQFPYLEMCTKEVMRMFPGNAFITREVTEDIQMDDGTFLPPGVTILIPSYSINMSPRYWKDPNIFNPDRFSPQSIAERSPYLFLPFGAGPRNCIGQKLATNIIKTVMIHLLVNYTFHSDAAIKDLSLYVDMMTVKSENGYPMRILPRN